MTGGGRSREERKVSGKRFFRDREHYSKRMKINGPSVYRRGLLEGKEISTKHEGGESHLSPKTLFLTSET